MKTATILESKYRLHKPNQEYSKTGTLSELIEYYGYTLFSGKSYENEKGNKKINLIPKTFKSLVSNLNNAANNKARNGYSDTTYSFAVNEVEK